jgi:hypothetical protein
MPDSRCRNQEASPRHKISDPGAEWQPGAFDFSSEAIHIISLRIPPLSSQSAFERSVNLRIVWLNAYSALATL